MIFYRLAAIQCPVYAMNQVKKSLEDVFIELTADTAAADAEGQNMTDKEGKNAAEDIQAKAGEYIAVEDDEKAETEAAAEDSGKVEVETAADSSNTDNGKEEA